MINNNGIVFLPTVSVHNGLENKVIGELFAYPRCEGEGSVDLEMLGNWFNECSLKWSEVHSYFVIKFFNFNLQVINYDQL